MANGIFIISELEGDLRREILELQRRFDPRLAALLPPHVTIVGSSGVGPINADVTAAELRAALAPIAESTEPIPVQFGPPTRFMGTDIVVLPLDPHGPLRTLHERIGKSGLPFTRARFTFTPHCTLSLYPTLTPEKLRALLAIRLPQPFVIDRLQIYRTMDAFHTQRVLELELGLSMSDTL